MLNVSTSLEGAIILVLASALAVVAYLLFRSRKQLAHYRHILDEIPNPLLRVDLTTFEPVFCNRKFSRLLGYSSNAECISRFPYHLHLPQKDFYQIYQNYKESGAGKGEEVEIHNRKGEPIENGIHVRLDPDEKYMDVVLDPIDIDSISQDQSPGAKQLLNKEVHHQLMNKLASIKGYSELIQSSTNLPGSIRDYAAEAITNSEQVRSVLDGGGDATVFCKFLDEIADKYSLAFGGDPIIPSNLSAMMLDKLVATSVGFMDMEGSPGKRRSITASSERFVNCSGCESDLGETSFAITIMDKDLFFDRENFKRLLLPGFVTTQLGEMTNLATVSEMAHAQGGHLRLTGGDEGFILVLFFPFAPEADPALLDSGAEDNHVLIIDDDLSVANYLKVVTIRAGYTATTFTDPRKALALFRQNPGLYDLVITDQTMPGLSGDAVMQTMLELRPELPIIMCTGYSEKVDADSAMALGAAGYVTKPVDATHLLQLIGNFFGAPSSE